MTLVTLEEPQSDPGPALLQMGFRPFFLGAAVFSLWSILAWMGVYVFQQPLYQGPYSPFMWHGHEMVFGYAAAVIAGFLLTAVSNWTGLRTLQGLPLLLLFLTWLAARMLFSYAGQLPIWLAAVADCGFLLWLTLALSLPAVRARRWKDIGLISKVLLLAGSDLAFFLGAQGLLPDGQRLGLYAGLYLVLALLFTMGRRVIPFFIERGLGAPVTLKNSRFVDMSSLVLFLAFAIVDLIGSLPQVTAWLAAALFLLHCVRLFGWYAPGVWRNPLVWILYLGYAWLVAGFALKSASLWFGLSPYLALHAFAYGGIGLITAGMMARVSIGHTGRSIFALPPRLLWMFLMLATGSLVRVGGPLLADVYHFFWIGLSQVLWVAGFGLFLYLYFPVLVAPRVVGK